MGVLDRFARGTTSSLAAVRCRFAAPAFPGETLSVSMWREGQRVVLVARVVEREVVVISNAYVDLTTESRL
eukprot:NODE_9991_length_349_cov_60.490000_g9083_i0.p1 GENE.NODE_9991_length_349_cov_60.490000_g9083_i0~~NODE_9991_length_349_cov_60.490000_g9083_i0.p1  ORF type:complete len:78 (+),score=22.63 NODE_9991_length_349_cov_60.490000_g9083_i0:24-236(+)